MQRLAIALLSLAAGAAGSVLADTQNADAVKPPAIPSPVQTYPDREPRNALRIGPGNTFSVSKTPKDQTLVSFTLSADGERIALGWESGQVDLFYLRTHKALTRFKSGLGAPYLLKFNAAGDRLVVTGRPDQINFLDPRSGKVLRKVPVEQGPLKYTIQGMALDSKDRWVAYVNAENGKVLDLMAESPRPLADLKQAGSLALSQDGSELWTVSRKMLTRFDTSTWKQTGEWPLASPPIDTSPVVVRAGVSETGRAAVAVPTSKGLLIYREPEMTAEYASARPTNGVAFASASRLFVNLSLHLTFLKPDGTIVCARSYEGRYDYSVSDDGQWLALSQSARVDLWRIEDLLSECAKDAGMAPDREGPG